MGPFTGQRSAFSLFSPERDAFGRPAPPAATRTDGNLPAIFRITWWMDSNSSELPSGGTTTQRKGESLMTTKISQWQRIAMLAAGISTSLVSMAWGQNLYQTHSDGSIWVSTGTPCNTVSCPGWLELDNNPNMNMIAAGGGALYQLHNKDRDAGGRHLDEVGLDGLGPEPLSNTFRWIDLGVHGDTLIDPSECV